VLSDKEHFLLTKKILFVIFENCQPYLKEGRMRLIKKIAQFLKNLFKAIPAIWQEGDVVYRDPLTKLFNRRFLKDVGPKEIKRSMRYDRPLSFAILDIDSFKEYNDREGHAKGDEVLKRVALALLARCRDSDLIVRYGGDEFVIMLPETNKEGTLQLLKDIKEELSPTGISYGVSTSTPEVGYSDLELMIKKADVEFYKNKKKKERA